MDFNYSIKGNECRVVLPPDKWEQWIKCCKAYRSALVSLKIILRNEEGITLLVMVPHNDYLPFIKHAARYE